MQPKCEPRRAKKIILLTRAPKYRRTFAPRATINIAVFFLKNQCAGAIRCSVNVMRPESEAMTTQSTASSSAKTARKTMPPAASSTSPGGKRETISPAERWLMIRANAYVRAQKRGFVGGNPYEDWLEAEEEVDSEYETDFRGVFSLTDPAGINEEVKSVFAVYGLDHLSVDALLEKHREGMEKLAAFNRKLIDSTSELANQQTNLVQDAVSEAVKTLQDVALGKMNTNGVTRQAELSMRAIENALSHVKALTDSVSAISPACAVGTGVPKKDSSDS